jgi:hypothetical protein
MRWAWIGVFSTLALQVGCMDDGVECICDLGTIDGSLPADAGASPQPMLVRAETGQILQSKPGEGVGVFVEYAAGGHWTIWWTCDTDKTARTCNYGINATTQSGHITNVAGYDGTTLTPSEGGPFDAGLSEAGPPAFPIQGAVTTQIQGITFDTDPGATIEVTATLDDSYDGSLFYFVDDNKVKDGYHGVLTDPLEFQPTSP